MLAPQLSQPLRPETWLNGECAAPFGGFPFIARVYDCRAIGGDANPSLSVEFTQAGNPIPRSADGEERSVRIGFGLPFLLVTTVIEALHDESDLVAEYGLISVQKAAQWQGWTLHPAAWTFFRARATAAESNHP